MSENGVVGIKRALLSTWDKEGLVPLAQALHKGGVQLCATGGTLKKLQDAGIPCVAVEEMTGQKEILGGRVKTLHPTVFAGLLARRDNPEDRLSIKSGGIDLIDLVIVNLYPFAETAADPDKGDSDRIEMIDIGGPSMIRAAAKNHAYTTVLTSPAQYGEFLNLWEEQGGLTLDQRRHFAAAAFAHTRDYDVAVSSYFEADGTFPESLPVRLHREASLRYGENPHQPAAIYRDLDADSSVASLLDARILAGKELSYNNYADLEAALELTLEFDTPFACVLKHANPCGAATASTLAEAYEKALEADPVSAFGSILGFNRVMDLDTAQKVYDTKFVECVLAPGYEPEALELLKKKKQRRILSLPAMAHRKYPARTFKFIRGGALTMTPDIAMEPDLVAVGDAKPSDEQEASLRFAWKIVKHVKSNAIVLAQGTRTVGIGGGQTSRVDAVKIACDSAGELAKGATLASDAFFPMPDGPQIAVDAGVTAFIQPGGSKKDEDVFEVIRKAGVCMVTTGRRHFRH
jgi:phosphoribosylaminoimidazolecarboxamide formyltransferase/IMP cyclohydrolase